LLGWVLRACVLRVSVFDVLLELLREAFDELDRDSTCLLGDCRPGIVFGARASRLGLAFSCFSTRLFVLDRSLLRDCAIASGVRSNTVQSSSNRGTHPRTFKWEQLLIISSGLDLLPARAIWPGFATWVIPYKYVPRFSMGSYEHVRGDSVKTGKLKRPTLFALSSSITNTFLGWVVEG
jgi:hypothetical protein